MKRLTLWLAAVLLSITAIALLLLLMGFRINSTNSIPVGIYRITAKDNFKNAFVIYCPDHRAAFQLARDRGYIDSGLCPGGYGYVMKKVFAAKGDTISVTDEGVFVNHQPVPFSKPNLSDGIDRPLPQWRIINYQLKKDEILTMTSQSKWSFDGRYYGPISIKQIKGVLTPIWVKNNTGERV